VFLIGEDNMSDYSMINLLAFIWFCLVWLGYAYFAKFQAKRGVNLSSVLNRQRLNWMAQVVSREHRIMDAALIANLERNTSFLASTSILVLAGLLTALGIVGSIDSVLQSFPFYEVKENSAFWVQVKILMLVVIYVYAFFALTWSMRQYGFASVMIGSAPSPEEAANQPTLKEKYIYASAKVIDMAGHAYNYGLRAYYFSLAILPWFVSPWLFMASSTLVVIVLYMREFHSRPYHVIRDYIDFCDREKEALKETAKE
jgi:uncharacterized membrane protein